MSEDLIRAGLKRICKCMQSLHIAYIHTKYIYMHTFVTYKNIADMHIEIYILHTYIHYIQTYFKNTYILACKDRTVSCRTKVDFLKITYTFLYILKLIARLLCFHGRREPRWALGLTT